MPGRRLLLLAALLLPVTTAAESIGERELSSSFLLGDAALAAPVTMRQFTMPTAAAQATHPFSGTLQLQDIEHIGGFAAVYDPFNLVDTIGDVIRHLPEFEFQFVQHGDDILPLSRGVIRREHPYWEIILQPGKAWSEPGDLDWTRASVPFALQERTANCTHYGVLTWLFNGTGEVSRVAYQISSETCAYFKFEMWGTAKARYQPEDLGGSAAAHIERFAAHELSRLPVRALDELADTYPGISPLSFGVADGIAPDDLTVLGLVADGVNYRSDCPTRRGPYPYCASIPLPSYSTAKSIFAGVATMRLKKMRADSSQASIASLIPECDRKKWRDVTIENALDMATGNFRSAVLDADEDSNEHVDFLYLDKHRDRLKFACNYFRRQAAPGTRFVYHTSDTYLVGAALAKLYREQGGSADFYKSVLVEPIWNRLNLSPLLDDTKRTYDQAAQPYTGYGLTYEADDILRIASWLHDDHGRLDGVAMLDDAMLDAALQRSPDDPGLQAGSENLRYNNGFRAFNAGPSIDCGEPVWVPYMSAYGGIAVVMFPNGVIYYYFSDSHVHRWQRAREAAHAIRSLC